MTVSVANGEIRVAVSNITENVIRQVQSRGARAVNAMRNAELETLNKPGSGRTYRKPGGGTYTASSPGEVPARRTGALRLNWTGDIKVTSSGSGSIALLATLTSNTPYAGYLQNGTRRMAARPFVEPIKEKALPQIAAIYSEPYF